jgi:hypothetical protein
VEVAGAAAVGSPWEAAGSHTAEAGVGRSRAVAGIGLEEGYLRRVLVKRVGPRLTSFRGLV